HVLHLSPATLRVHLPDPQHRVACRGLLHVTDHRERLTLQLVFCVVLCACRATDQPQGAGKCLAHLNASKISSSSSLAFTTNRLVPVAASYSACSRAVSSVA